MTIFAAYARPSEAEDKKDVFAPIADLMVGVVFIFIVILLAMSLVMVDDVENAVPKSVYDAAVEQAKAEQARADREKQRADAEEAARRRLAGFVRYVRDSGVVPVLSRMAEADTRRNEILERLKERLLVANINVEIDRENGTLRLPSTRLFESARADPTPEGRSVIQALGVAIADIVPCYLANAVRPSECPDVGGSGILSAIYIEGHTDAASFRTPVDRFRNNWDLSAARAIEAFRIVSDSDPRIAELKNAEGKALVGVSGYAETRPSRDGLTPEQRLEDAIKETDRRIEVRLIMTVDRQEILSTVQELNRRLEGLDADLN